MPARSIVLVLLASDLDRTHAAYEAVNHFVEIYDREVDRIEIVGPESVDIDDSIVESVPVERPRSETVPSNILSYVRYQFRIAMALWRRRRRTDAAFFHVGGSMLLVPLLASKLAHLRTFVFVLGSVEAGYYTQHGTTTFSLAIGRIIELVEGLTCALATEVIVLSKRMDVPDIPVVPSPTIRVANLNYVDCTAFEKRTPVDERSTDVVFVGRFASVKGIDRVRRALPALVESNPEIQVTLIGAGPRRAAVETSVDRNDLSDNVTITGWVDHEELPTLLDDAKVLLMPSRSEGVPKALLEAMACGTVPVATPVGGIPDVVADGENGVLLREATPKAIERTISRVLERDELEQLSDAARETIRREHAYPSISDRYRQLLGDSA